MVRATWLDERGIVARGTGNVLMTSHAVVPPYVRPAHSTVVALFTAPGTIIDDVAQLMTLAGLAGLAGLADAMPRDVPTGLHVNIS